MLSKLTVDGDTQQINRIIKGFGILSHVHTLNAHLYRQAHGVVTDLTSGPCLERTSHSQALVCLWGLFFVLKPEALHKAFV